MTDPARARAFRKRRWRRWLITHPRLPLSISWKLRRFATTPEQEEILRLEMRALLNGVLHD